MNWMATVTAQASRAVARQTFAQAVAGRQCRSMTVPAVSFRGTQAQAQEQSQQEPQPAQQHLVVAAEDFASKSKLRLDAFLAARLPGSSRARLQASIKEGLVTVNGKPQAKASHGVREGDLVCCRVLPPPPLEAAPEPLPLDIVYEDEHVIVINKAADMVMHPSPGHYHGTLVNALLHHCRLPGVQLGPGAAAPLSLEAAAAAAAAAAVGSETAVGGLPPAEAAAAQLAAAATCSHPTYSSEPAGPQSTAVAPQHPSPPSLPAAPAECSSSGLQMQPDMEDVEGYDDDDEEAGVRMLGSMVADGTVRPGIVHRLDRGTTGLVVVAKTDAAHASLAQQFKDRSVKRTYWSITLGVPRPAEGRVATNVGRDLRDRKRMAAFAYGSAIGRTAGSHYRVLQVLAGGSAALVEWRLETGRTHQIRVHAKHLGHPLFADGTYSSAAAAASIVGANKPPRAAVALAAARALARPALHAKTLGFQHPASGELVEFNSEVPEDLRAALEALQGPPFC